MKKVILTFAVCVAPTTTALAEYPIVPSQFDESLYQYACVSKADNDPPLNGCATWYASPALGDEGKMRFLCKDSHYSYDDPIVFPGQPGATHLHMFFGNPATDANSTFQTLRTNIALGTCAGGPLNNTGYWAPAMIRPQNNSIVQPDFIEFYYTVNRDEVPAFTSPVCSGSGLLQDGRAAACPMQASQKIERGMKALFGFQPSTGVFPVLPGPSGGTTNFQWSCTNVGINKSVFWDRSNNANGIQSCPSGETIQVRMITPNCWDGNYDSVSHYTQLAWGGQDGFSNVVCPATHPKRIPSLTIIIAWKTFGESDYSQWYLSSDRFNGANYEAGQSFHSDAYWAWSQNIMDAWSGNVNGVPNGNLGGSDQNSLKIGSDGVLGNGFNMVQASIGITSDQANGRYIPVPPLKRRGLSRF